MKSMYIVYRHSRQTGYIQIELRRFIYKRDALESAANSWNYRSPTYVMSCETKQITYILPRGRSSCHVCGNQLDGKKHCLQCNALHHYV